METYSLILMENKTEYESVKEKIIKNQQVTQIQHEIIYIAILLGFFINFLSSIIYDIILSNLAIDKLSLLFITSFILLSLLFVILQYFFKTDTQINILHFSYNPYFIDAYEDVFTSEIRKKLMENGISNKEFITFFKRYEHAIKKLIEKKEYGFIGNDVVRVEENSDSIKEIIIDTSKGNIKSYMSIIINPLGYPPLFRENKIMSGEYYSIYLEINMYLKNPRNKNSLKYFDDIYRRKNAINNLIQSMFLLVLGYNWNLIDVQDLPYNLIKYFEIDKII